MKLKKLWIPISFLITAFSIGYAIAATNALDIPLFPVSTARSTDSPEKNQNIVTERFNNVKIIVEDILKKKDNEEFKNMIPKEAIDWLDKNQGIIKKIEEEIPKLNPENLKEIRELSDRVFDQNIFDFIKDEKNISGLVDEARKIFDRNGINIDGKIPNIPPGIIPSTT
ncbi:Hypothetical protein, predicted transmembrane protein [Mycoplasma yeatsii 13926]|uniref:Uncharacterized protein n=1 Tax=Mycoplasma yeatsii 13926 TaxID=1188240 RepID=S6G3T7_9MOLU|nr:hypothetical protein [Mycoplasma yeatsii]EOA07162.1 Hypothetical protein, predicted transmembrane protein [Mycoplasma yeatsii 13926]